MDRDTFWDSARDLFFISLKIVLAFLVLQIVLMASGSDVKLPLIHGYMMSVFNWWKNTFAGIRFGV